MDYNDALTAAVNGAKVRINTWPEGEYVYYSDGKYVIKYAQGYENPYVLSNVDMDSLTWSVVAPE